MKYVIAECVSCYLAVPPASHRPDGLLTSGLHKEVPLTPDLPPGYVLGREERRVKHSPSLGSARSPMCLMRHINNSQGQFKTPQGRG